MSEGQCFRCREEEETGLHALISCSAIREVWWSAGYVNFINAYKGRIVADFILQTFDTLDKPSPELLCILAWYIWCNRNKMMHGNHSRRRDCILTYARDYLEEFFRISSCFSSSRLGVKATVEKWQKPPLGFLKLNVNASVTKYGSHAGVGAVVRDYKGYALGILAKKIDDCFSPYVAECIALIEGL